MRELIKIVIFHEKEIIFKSIYITLTFYCTKFEVNFYIELQNRSEAIQFHLFTFEPYY
jgi:hypothetical protein